MFTRQFQKMLEDDAGFECADSHVGKMC
jgi:hypothetical protein